MPSLPDDSARGPREDSESSSAAARASGGGAPRAVRKEDDLELLRSERAAADREYNDALTRLDHAIQRLPTDFPHPPPRPDQHQIAPLNTLWKIDLPPAGRGIRARFAAAVRRAVAPLFEQQQAFNSALVDHINRNRPIEQQAQESLAATLTVLHDQLAELVSFQSVLVMFLQQITPYVDTRDRDVAGLLRGLSGAINAVADEVMKRSEAALSRDRRHEARVQEVEAAIADVRLHLDTLQRTLARPGEIPRG
jgi:hypothetical protein